MQSVWSLLAVFAISILCLCIGCRQSSSPPTASPPDANGGTPIVSAEADLSMILAEMTQAVRKYSAEKRRVPGSLNEVVAAGYIKKLPQPPPGKSFAIDPKSLQVIVK